jgi:triphosphoribosyl-dephospho-CoA synthase
MTDAATHSSNSIDTTISQLASMACLLEVSAPKPGNVHRGADFDDMTFDDFLLSSIMVGPALGAASAVGVGQSVLSAIEARCSVTAANTNLGLVLLIAPLAAVPADLPLRQGIGQVLSQLTSEDCRLVYQAIRLASPGGLGEQDDMDVHETPPDDLLAAMAAASDRDLIARQYSNQFEDLLASFVPWLVEEANSADSLSQAIVRFHVRIMAAHPDSLIQRKCGLATAEQSAALAAGVLNAADTATYHEKLAELDFWLRADHNRRNPGTTADMVGASLFAALRDKQLELSSAKDDQVEIS